MGWPREELGTARAPRYVQSSLMTANHDTGERDLYANEPRSLNPQGAVKIGFRREVFKLGFASDNLGGGFSLPAVHAGRFQIAGRLQCVEGSRGHDRIPELCVPKGDRLPRNPTISKRV